MSELRYWCPITVDEEPKWINGVMTIRQGVYASGAVLAGIGIFVLLQHAWILSLILAAVPALAAYAVGWNVHAPSGETLDRAILLAYRFKKSQKIFLDRGVLDERLARNPQTR